MKNFLCLIVSVFILNAGAFCQDADGKYLKQTYQLDILAQKPEVKRNAEISEYLHVLQDALILTDHPLEQLFNLEMSFYSRMQWDGVKPTGVVDINGAVTIKLALKDAQNASEKALAVLTAKKFPAAFAKSHAALIEAVKMQNAVLKSQYVALDMLLSWWEKALKKNTEEPFPAEKMNDILRSDKLYYDKLNIWIEVLNRDYYTLSGGKE